ncbi:MAG TPA: AMP-binding protein, partial [Clostridia bacterium]|nr:AMP-binding protein [Clostridia bacterium]
MIEMTIGDWMEKIAAEYPQTEAVVYPHRGLRWTYREFVDIVNQAAKALIALGVKHGEHVSVWATNYPEWLVLQFATAKVGAVLVTVNTNYKRYELEYLLRQSDTSTLFMIGGFKDNDYLSHIYAICPELETAQKGELTSAKLPYLKRVIYIGGADNSKAPAGMYRWDEFFALGKQITDEQLDARARVCQPHECINMQYTSGTTGFPKGVMLTHYNILNNGKSIGDCMNLTPVDRLCIPVPLFHCFGCVLGVLACVTHATTMVMVEYFNPLRVMEAIQWEKCTAVHGVPTMFISILEHPDFNKYDFSTLRTGIMAGSPCPIEYMRKCVDKMHMTEITIAYGQTESSPVLTQTRMDDSLERRVSTVGRCLPGVEVKIIDINTGKDAPYGVQGE